MLSFFGVAMKRIPHSALILCLILVVPISMCITGGEDTAEPVVVDPSLRMVEVVYFHETRRCTACINIEKWAYEAVHFSFLDAYADGRLTYRSINIDDRAHAALISSYGACYTSLYVNAIYGGSYHIVELTEAWLLSDKKDAFMAYVEEAIANALGELP